MPVRLARTRLSEYTLLWAVGLCMILGFFLWLPNSTETLWLRRFDVYLAGGFSLLYIWTIHKKPHVSAIFWVVMGLLLLTSTVSLLRSPSVSQGLIGQPIIHPSLLSLYASVAIGLLFAYLPHKRHLFVSAYGFIAMFAVASLAYWLLHGASGRLGVIGEQINYTAYLLLIGFIIGCWIYAKKQLSPHTALSAQALLFITTTLTQSRVAIVLLVLCFLYAIWYRFRWQQKSGIAISLLIVVFVMAGLSSSFFRRVHSEHYFAQSVRYRYDLVLASLPHSASEILLGGGVGSIEHNIATRGLTHSLIAHDLKNGWRFESSHNYPVDIFVERGLLVLIIYVWLLIVALKEGLKSTNSVQRLLVAILVVTLLFSFFNNINIELEVILWCCLIGLLQTAPKRAKL